MLFRKLSLYHRTVLMIYVVVMILVFTYFGKELYFSMVVNNLSLTIFFLTQVLLLVYLFFENRGLSVAKDFGLKTACLVMVYGLVFAVPEEIIFRGVIQGIFLSSLDTHIAIFASSVIFGFVHIFNSSKSFRIKDWNIKLAGLSFLAGLPLGYLFYLTQSLFLPILLHASLLFWLQVYGRESKDKVK